MTTDSSAYAKRLPLWVVIGAVTGIAVGVFFGERVDVLDSVGEGYVRLMEIVVFPYIICSLLHGLGRLSPETAWKVRGVTNSCAALVMSTSTAAPACVSLLARSTAL